MLPFETILPIIASYQQSNRGQRPRWYVLYRWISNFTFHRRSIEDWTMDILDTLDRPSVDTPSIPRLTLDRHLFTSRSTVGRASTNFRSIYISVSTDCSLSVDNVVRVSIEMSIEGVDQEYESTPDHGFPQDTRSQRFALFRSLSSEVELSRDHAIKLDFFVGFQRAVLCRVIGN